MRRFLLLVVYAMIFMLIGRNISFLPQLDFRSEEKKTEELKEKVETYIKTQQASFSIYYKDLRTGKQFGIDENKVLTGASINKPVIIAYLYSLAEKGKIDLEEKVVIQEDDIQDYGTGSLRYEEAGRTYTLKSLAKLSLEKSDNTAAHVLGVKLGMDKIQRFAQDTGLTSTDMENNKITAYDLGKLLELIYANKITSSALTRELLDFMKDTDFEDRLARFIGDKAAVYHKSGDAINMIHDAGIIDPSTSSGQDGKNPFILVVLTIEAEDEEATKKAIGEIAKIIYEQGR